VAVSIERIQTNCSRASRLLTEPFCDVNQPLSLQSQARKSNRKVFDALVERQKERARFWFHDGAIGWITRKSLDGIHRLPEGQDLDLNDVTSRSTKH
jgi:hypothetical protein